MVYSGGLHMQGEEQVLSAHLFLSPSPAENEIHSLTLITAYKALHALASSSTSPIFSSIFLNITHIPAAMAFFLTLRGQTSISGPLYVLLPVL